MKNAIKALIVSSTLSLIAVTASAQFTLSVGISIHTAPPALPVYVQPACPVDGYLWVPGYWAYDDVDGYYWVPGVWMAPPTPGYLWTPGYWGYAGGIYGWHGGYWGVHVGYYGGVNYGCGYGGVGFVGGGWSGGVFRYNTAVMNVNTTVIHNTYVNRTVINNTTINNHTSFNGPGGVQAQPTAEERVAMNEHHVQPTSAQFSHNTTASHDRNAFASVNNGHPSTVAMNKIGGQRFSPQGHSAPAPVARPAGGIHPNSVAANTHSMGNSHPATVNNNHPATMNNHHPAATNNNHPNTVTNNHPRTMTNNHPATQSHPQTQYHPQQSHPQQSHPQTQSHPQPQQRPREEGHHR